MFHSSLYSKIMGVLTESIARNARINRSVYLYALLLASAYSTNKM